MRSDHAIICASEIETRSICAHFDWRISTVSYTHLDVYKRQLQHSVINFQMDMQALLDEQMRRKLADPEQPVSGQNSPASAEKKRSSRRLFGLFQR